MCLFFFMNVISELQEPLLFFGFQRLHFSILNMNIEPQVSIVVHGLLQVYCTEDNM